jgi:multiple sugar transport system ATP-binding protein
VALSRALAKEPGVLLLDEPLSNLDAKLRASARDELQRFQRRLGITTIFVTHDQIEALGMGDRIVVMSGGKIVQVGTPKAVYHDSANIFVAQFLGSPGMNILDMDDFLVGFRPEQFVHQTGEGINDQQKTFSFSVTRVEYLGADQLIYGNVEGYAREYSVVAKSSSESTSDIEANNTYDFVVNKDQLRYFRKETGLRIEPRSF